jgi:hypothetical protein
MGFGPAFPERQRPNKGTPSGKAPTKGTVFDSQYAPSQTLGEQLRELGVLNFGQARRFDAIFAEKKAELMFNENPLPREVASDVEN